MPTSNQSVSREAKVHAASVTAGRSALDFYLDDLAHSPTMPAPVEYTEALRILELKRAYVRAIASYPPFSDAIVGVIRTLLPEAELSRELGAWTTATKALKRRRTNTTKQGYDQAVKDLAEAMLDADPDGEVPDRIAADLRELAGPLHHTTLLEVRRPPEQSKVFRAYVDRVHAAGNALRSAKAMFVRANLRLVAKMAHKYDRGLMPLPDLIQEGNLGLLKAVDRFDPRKGFRFSTYATWWIRHAVTRAIANTGRTIRIPAHMSATHYRVARASSKFRAENGRSATNEELATLLAIPEDKVDRTKQALHAQLVSLDTPLRDDASRTLADMMPDDDAEPLDAHLDDEVDSSRLRQAMNELTPLEQDIVRHRFGLDVDREFALRELGAKHSLSRERIRQIQNRAIEKLRAELQLEA